MRASVWVAVEKILQQGLWFLLFLFIARILGPKTYGQFAIVVVFTQFCEIMVVEATVEAVIGMKPLSAKHIMTANAISLAVAASMGVLLFVLAPFISNGFGEPELEPIFRALSILPTLSALTASPTAILRSELRFKVLAIRSTAGLVFGGACGILLALNGAGIWALVAQTLVQKLAEIAVLFANTRRFRLGFYRRHLVQLKQFAAPVFFSRGLVFIAAQTPRIVLGLFLGPLEVGLYTFATRFPDTLAILTLVPTTVVARTTLRQHADRQKALEEAFWKLLRNTALIAFPVFTGAAAVIPLFITIALDASWAPAILPSQILIIALMTWSLNYGSSALLLATNHPQAEAQMSVAQTVSTFFVLFAAPFGVEALCIASTVRWALLVPVTLVIVWRSCKIRPSLVLNALAAPFAASVLMGLGVALLGVFASSRLTPLAALPLLATFGVILYGLLISFSERARILGIIDKFRGARSISAPIAPPPAEPKCI